MSPNATPPKERKPYVKPEVLSTPIYERLALGCNQKAGPCDRTRTNPSGVPAT